ncbi:host attachment protein [Elioraea sp. Yellowstone]|jgi:protein required for attachment to host cells|uniref:host attachment protein n=1 Tax=Elioraea sp. Yellowstone TaxID=2592070 RepID=UPI0011515963|nr:host attachment protein [Elioraea sp. Yellowstone]TQF84840.1 host attachment protein [Elioraea sp. Yellowstone]
MPNRTTWFVIADAARAEALVKRKGVSGYETVRTWENPDVHAKAHELGEDKPGRAFDSLGPHRSAMEPRETPKEAAKKDFARELVAALEAAVTAGETQAIVLVAPPKLLGEMRALMPAGLAAAVREDHAKDYTQLPRAELFARLDEMRPVGAG